MISENAVAALQQIFARAVSASLAMVPGDRLGVEALAAPTLAEAPQRQIVVLTITSYRFRLLTLFHLHGDRAGAEYFTRGDPARSVAEVFGELGNLCCGAMKRELGQYFPHTGMSTPYLLEGPCASFLESLDPAHVAHYRISVGGSPVLHASLCLCAYAPIDFHLAAPTAVEATGELELF